MSEAFVQSSVAKQYFSLRSSMALGFFAIHAQSDATLEKCVCKDGFEMDEALNECVDVNECEDWLACGSYNYSTPTTGMVISTHINVHQENVPTPKEDTTAIVARELTLMRIQNHASRLMSVENILIFVGWDFAKIYLMGIFVNAKEDIGILPYTTLSRSLVPTLPVVL
ncbi:predicted protein [Chaetoceros tenuissimus]|uniref:Uncharacterized protein n=1 Tax=Chaetoceros tenuissimus TaxID=426638 RepID=A0AAD3CIK8_9STRA|nr:predicted protein [Chaetoceros tenuissimus]